MSVNSLQSLQLNKQRATKLFQQGKLKAAKTILQKICKKGIKDAETYYLLGSIYAQVNDLDKALSFFNKASELSPEVVVIYLNMGIAYSASNKFEDACKAFTKAYNLEPKNYDIVLNLGLTLAQLNLNTESIQYLEQALVLNSDSKQALQTLGGILYKEKDYEQAIIYYERLNAVDPGIVTSWFTLGSIYFLLTRANKAIECFNEIIKLDTANFKAYANLGLAYKLIGERDKALKSYNTALSYDEYNTVATIGVIDLLERNGDYDEAYGKLIKLIDRGVHHADLAVSYLRLCHHFGDCDSAAEYADTMLEIKDVDDLEISRLEFALGRFFDKRKEFDMAFSHYRKANLLNPTEFSKVDSEYFFSNYIRQFDWQFFTQASRSIIRSQRPVFIVGMPRSGTTLIEQILASHPDVYGAGELTGIGDIAVNFSGILQKRSAPYPSGLLDLNSDDMDTLTQYYLDILSGMNNSSLKVVDKMPSNYLHLGLINLLFPEAKIIHCTRNPLDTCLSIYFQGFSDAEPYANNLENIAFYYDQYKSFMKHIKITTSLQVLDMGYEDMVTDQEVMTRKLINFIGLEWDDRCLSFNKNKRFVATPSYDQVREKMYTTSVGRWRNYEKFLDGAIKVLGYPE